MSAQDTLMELSRTAHRQLLWLFYSLALYFLGLAIRGGANLHLAEVKDQGWFLWVQEGDSLAPLVTLGKSPHLSMILPFSCIKES